MWVLCLVFGLRLCGGGGGGSVALEGWCCVMSVFVVSLDSLCISQVQVSVYCAKRIHVHLRCTVFKPVAPYRYLLPTVYLSVTDILNPRLLACGCQTWISMMSDTFCTAVCHCLFSINISATL